MITPETPQTFHAVCSYWAKIIKTKGENGTQIWVTCESPRHRLKDFVEDRELQDEIFGIVKPKMILLDGYEQDDIDYEDLKIQISESLGYTIAESNSALSSWFVQNTNRQLVFFLVGFNNALRHNNTVALQRIAMLPTRHALQDLKVILLTEFNILESESYNVLLRSSNILQNIQFQPLFAEKDIIQFSNYFAEQWNLKISEKMVHTFVEDIGGHYLLVKEAMRLVRDNPSISKVELLSAPSMVRKGMAIFEKLSEEDQTTIRDVLHGKKPQVVSEYLSQLHLVKNDCVGLPYWNHIKDKIFVSSTETSHKKIHSIDFYFTSTERDVFELLMEEKKIVSREQVAEKIWHKNWEDKYSDWAIDQLMHRIREKLKLTSSPYSILTKKGQGFFMIQKD